MGEMSDRGFVSGFIGVGIHMTIQHILQDIHIANCCKKELADLKELVMGIDLTIMHIQQNLMAFKSGEDKDTASAVNKRLGELDSLLLGASKMVQRCSIPKSRLYFSGRPSKKEIWYSIKAIREHLELSPLLVRIPEEQVGIPEDQAVGDTQKVQAVGDTQKVLEGLGKTKDSLESLASSATTSQAARKNLIVGQYQAFESLQKLVIDNVEAKKIGVLGQCGSGKTLHLLTLFNSQEVRDHFRNGLLLWVTVSQRPYIKDLCEQIAIQKKIDLSKAIKEGDEKRWLSELLKQKQSSRSALFLDDVSEGNATELLDELGISECGISKIIVSSRDRTALEKMGVEDKYRVTIKDLMDFRNKIEKQDEKIEKQDEEERKQDLDNLEKFITDDAEADKIGVVRKRVAAKILLKPLFDSQKVRNHFSKGLLLWLSLSQSVTSVVNDLCQQIAEQQNKNEGEEIEQIAEQQNKKEEEDEKEEDKNKNEGEEKEVTQKNEKEEKEKEDKKKEWLNTQLQQSSRFALFLDDGWERNARELFEELGLLEALKDPTKFKVIVTSGDFKFKVIVTSGDFTALPETGVAEEADSWQLFKQYAFPYNEGNLPPSDIVKEKAKLVCDHIVKEKANLVCDQCERIPVAIKVVGRAMASSTHPQQWDWALHRLRNAKSLNDCLRLSFDALGNDDVNMQLCFQHVAAAFPQDEIIEAQEVIPLWMGEGLLARKKVEHVPRHVLADHCLIEPMIRNTEGRPVCLRLQDPFEIGRLYLDLLAERCLIEPTARDADGHVLCFRMLKIVRELANPIAQHEEYFYCGVGKGLKDLPEIEIRESKRIFLSRNELSSLPQFSSSPKMCSLLISQNEGLKKIPKTVIPTMLFLKVLDLSGTSARSLPENVGRLKDLRCLKLSGTQIKRLPKSLRDLGQLEILDVSFTDIKELPSDIHMLRSLRYLGLRGCEHLQNLPYSISGLLSLQYLYMDGCCKWRKRSTNKCKNAMDGCRKGASLESLGDLIQLKQLALQNDWEDIPEGTLEGMTEMDTLLLVLAETVSLPLHISDMSKLRRLSLKCSKLSEMDPFVCFNLTETQRKMKNDVTHLKNLSYLKFYECSELKNFQHLHKLPNLIQLEIILCPKVENFPPEFGRIEAFPSLKTFSLVGLHNLQGLPEREKGAMPSLEIFSMIDCPKLRMPQSYLNLGSRIRIRLYGCPNVNEEHKHMVQQVLLPNPTETKKIIKNYLEIHRKKRKMVIR